MENIATIKKQLRHGDYKLIAELAGCSQSIVSHILSTNIRNHDTPSGKKIIKIARVLISNRKILKEKMDNEK